MAARKSESEQVAIVGMACIFPGAPDLDAYRDNLREGRTAITEVPASRWESVFYDPDANDPARFYCRRGGFIDEYARFDALSWGVMPATVEGTEPDQLLALEVAAKAIADAGTEPAALPRERTGVIFGRGGYVNAGMTRLSQRVREAEQLVTSLRALLPDLPDERLDEVKHAFREKIGRGGPDTAIGVVSNLSASRVANRLDLGGPAYTIDAACASSLIAVERACTDLVMRRSDVVLAGGVHLTHDVSFWSVFTQLGALSHSQTIRPFDRRADGLLIGEGIGVVVLKRLDDAVRQGDRIYATIRGTGVSSDGRGASLMVPRVAGQLRALERAWEMAGLDPLAAGSVGLIEAHGTATPAGDEAETATLLRFFGERAPRGKSGRIALGSVKSMIGHAMPAAGVAGVIKAALALHHRTLLPTLSCEEPREELEGSRFDLLAEARPWESSGRRKRRAAVNAFGFGGINAHILLEEPRSGPVGAPAEVGRRAAEAEGAAEQVLLMAANDPESLLARLEAGDRARGDGPCRLAIFSPDDKKLARATKAVAAGRTVRGRGDIFFSPSGLLSEGGKVAFLYPGVDQEFAPRTDDVAREFGRDPLPALDPGDLGEAGVGIVLVNQLLTEVLAELGLEADMVAGHSIGEWSAMIAAGSLSVAEIRAFIAALEPGKLQVPGVVFAAAGCGADKAADALEGLDDAVVSHDNCPHQVILCGREESIDVALERLAGAGVLCQKLSFRSGFHSPFFAEYSGAVREDFDGLTVAAPGTPIWSATTCEPYPVDPEAIRELVVRHLLEPVRFREVVLAMHDAGARVFVQAGTGSLVGFADDSLRGLPHLVMGANVPRREGLDQLRRLVASVWVEGARGLDLDRLFGEDPGAAAEAAKRGIPLKLGAPLVVLDERLDVSLAGPREGASAGAPVEDPVLAAFDATLRAVERSGADVVDAWKRRPGAPTEQVFRRTLDLETDPHLWDHCFYRQPVDWADVSDRFPVAPMTMSLGILAQTASRLMPELLPVAIEDVRAFKWIAVEEPVTVEIAARWDGVDTVEVAIRGYLEGKVRMARAWPAAPAPRLDAPFEGEAPAPITARDLYDDRWMFHGPSYQGVVALHGMGDDGVEGTLEALPAEGALLDCAGQLLGYWVMTHVDVDKLAMPVRLGAIRFYGPDPEPGERLRCRVRITHLGPRQVRADMELHRGGRVWAVIEGWEDRRFDTDARSWPLIRYPERHLLAIPRPEASESSDGAAICWIPEGFRSRMSQDYFARRFLAAAERAHYESLPPKRQAEWLAGRIAAKDAVRSLLGVPERAHIFPVEVSVSTDASGRPRARCRDIDDLHVSIAHKGATAIAIAARGRPVGVDIEEITLRDEAFERQAFTAAERALLPGEPDARAEAQTRLWAAKEAVAKLLGTGLDPTPRHFEVSAIDPDGAVAVSGHIVRTARDADRMIAWVR